MLATAPMLTGADSRNRSAATGDAPGAAKPPTARTPKSVDCADAPAAQSSNAVTVTSLNIW
jgi:hypothetical protein